MTSALADTLPTNEGDDQPTEATYGRFVSLGVIARGGMGVVLRAKDPELDREVALKLLGPTSWGRTGDTIGAQQLQREAQALAKLQHPNVVTVYEMGRIGTQTFIAMELVDGVTLRGWLADPRSARDILHAFIACGRGLAAAHAAGLVHRDFKPENVLIGADQRPRVSDFGLVATGLAVGADVETTNGGVAVEGTIVGTPGYMAPEQWLGSEIDARTDQFAFCVALWEALTGVRPFPGESGGEIRDRVLGGSPETPARRPARAIEHALRRGMSRARGDRWPSMDALLARLEVPTSRKMQLLAGGGALVAGGLIATLLLRSPDECAIAGDRLDDVWNPAIAARVDTAFRASGTPYAASQLARVTTSLAAYASELTSATVETCRAQHSDLLRDRRMLCLERGRLALTRIVSDLMTADRTVVERSTDAVARLPDLASCSDLERLDAATAPPTEPGLRDQLRAIQQQLADAEGQTLRGEHAKALATNKAAVAAARTLAHAPTLSAALLALGGALLSARDLAAAETAYREAASAAADGRDDLAAADAWVSVLFAAAERNEKLEIATALEPVAEAAVRRAGNPTARRYHFLAAAGVLADMRTDYATAHARFTAALELAGTNIVWRAESTRNLASVIRKRDGAIKAVDTMRLAATLMEQARGPDHPDTAAILQAYGETANEAGRYTEARPILERALAIFERVFGHETVPVSQALKALGNVIMNLGDYPTARARYDEAIAIEDRIGAPEATRAISVAGLAVLLSDAGQRAESLPYYTRSLVMLERTSGTETNNYLMMSAMYAQALFHLERCAEALPVLAKIDAALAKLPHLYPEALAIGARCARATGQLPAALAALEKAAALCAKHACEPTLPINLRFGIGQLLVETKQDPKKGRALVEQARTEMLALDKNSPLIAEADTWLRANR